ncbi:MAG: hypothetical protein LBF60_08605 [Treponema sp.]|jgi:GntP family gluconate:H+ symporter|nr:hypothetical protein [Treponema sp.]
MTGFSLVIGFIIPSIVMIFAISKLKRHPFFSIMAASLIFGLIGGIPPVKRTRASGGMTVVALSIGLYASRAFILPLMLR